MTQSDFLKLAFTYGVARAAAEAGMTKESNALWNLTKLVGSKFFGSGAKATAGAAGTAAQTATNVAGAAPMGWGGKIWSGVGKVHNTMAAPLRLFGLDKGQASAALGFGHLMGGINALTAEPGNRWSAYGKGLLTGAAGGVGWEHGTRMGLGGLKKLTTGSKFFGKNMSAPNKQMFQNITNPKGDMFGYKQIWNSNLKGGDAAKQLGAKALGTTAALGGAFGLSGAAESAAKTYIPGLQDTSAGMLQGAPAMYAHAQQ